MYFFAALWVHLKTLDETKYRNDTDNTYVHNKPVTIWR